MYWKNWVWNEKVKGQGLEIIKIQQDRYYKKKPNWNQFRAIQFPPTQINWKELNSCIMQMWHNLQNCTLCCPSKYYNVMLFTIWIYLGIFFHYKHNKKNLNLIHKKLGLNHSFASTTLSVEAQIPNVFEMCLEILMFAMDWR